MSAERAKLSSARRWVIKIGSALVTDNGCGLRRAVLEPWVRQIATLSRRGLEFVIVSSGAIAEGVSRLGWRKRPAAVHELQAAAAIGQMGLVRAYADCFRRYGKHTAQVLLTHDDIASRSRYLNARTTLNSLIRLGVIPIINENDTVATDEIRFGDNDTLGGLVANLIEADALALLTDQAGLYSADPRRDVAARLIGQARVTAPELEGYAGEGSALGRGGMRSKLKAARIAARSGALTLIASGMEENVLLKLAGGEPCGTLLYSDADSIGARKQWLANQNHLRGAVSLDDGAVKALREKGKSLLPVGVKSVRGDFKRGEIIACLDSNGREIARGLSNYDAAQSILIMGKSSKQIRALLGQFEEDELIHRDNLILS